MLVLRLGLVLVLLCAAALGQDEDEPATYHAAVDPVESGNHCNNCINSQFIGDFSACYHGNCKYSNFYNDCKFNVFVKFGQSWLSIFDLKHFASIDDVEDDLVEKASKNDSIELSVIWKISLHLKFLLVQANKAGLDAIMADKRVVYVEQDGWVKVQGKTSDQKVKGDGKEDKEVNDLATKQWALDRIDQRNMPLDGKFRYHPNGGNGSNIYVIGTGVNEKHEDFGGRAVNIYDFRGENFTGRDCSGHGTHVASLAAGKKYGVARQAKVYGVRLTRCRGDAKVSDAVKGINWLAEMVARNCVALVEVASSSKSPSLDNAIHRLYTAGCVVVVPAGNNNSKACEFSPSRMKGPITVGATTKADYAVFFSNQDECVDIFAPGLAIEGAFYDSRTASQNMSGTSMAAGYVAGAAAVHLANDMRLFKVKPYLVRHATEYQLRGVENGAPNKLLYVGKVSSRVDYNRPIKEKMKSKKGDAEEEKEKESKSESMSGKNEKTPGTGAKTEL
ncbi:extracellular serine proteinase-like [Diadema setosum]|uniref:extracellular serine proteinase-like n=1 Tax=Diadema setosum TaxID=31175 RepID=UPI003B3AD671